MKRYTCPKCRRRAYPVCSNPECICYASVPKRCKPLEHTEVDGERCPYCGFTAHIDYWFERELALYADALA